MDTTLEIESALSEKQISWKAFVLGDNNAIAMVYKHLLPQLLFVAYQYLKDEEKAKDVVSDIFERLISMSLDERKIKLSGVNEKLEVFFSVIVKNRCINIINTEKNRNSIIKKMNFFVVKTEYPNELQQDDFECMLELLPLRQKEIIQLNIAGFKNNEIAEQLNITENTVKNTLVNAKKKIKEIYTIFMS